MKTQEIKPSELTREETNILLVKWNQVPEEEQTEVFCEALNLAEMAIRELRKMRLELAKWQK